MNVLQGDYGFGNVVKAMDPMTASAEFLSLVFTIASFLILLYLVARVKTTRSFQFEMFVFALVLGAAEVPKIALDVSGLNVGILVTYGLEIHSVSMVILAAFVAYRIFGFFRGKTVEAK